MRLYSFAAAMALSSLACTGGAEMSGRSCSSPTSGAAAICPSAAPPTARSGEGG
jgi:hypothetical protein